MSAPSGPHRTLDALPSSGIGFAAVTPTTPGRAPNRSSSSRATLARPSGVGSPTFASPNVTTPLGSKPGAARCNATKLRIISPEPTRRTNASATSAVTTPARSHFPAPDSDELRPLARSMSATSTRDARTAGTMPKISADAIAAAAVKPRTTGSRLTWSSRGRLAGPIAMRTLIPAHASPTPNAAPATDSTRLSTSICRSRSPRFPPNADRTASSRSRWLVRTSRRLATLAHAISSTNTTAPISVHSDCLVLATR